MILPFNRSLFCISTGTNFDTGSYGWNINIAWSIYDSEEFSRSWNIGYCYSENF